MIDKVECVARALYRSYTGNDPYYRWNDRKLRESVRETWRKHARAALAAAKDDTT